MTLQELADACTAAIARGSQAITIVLPGYSRGNSRRLFGRRGPKGEVVSDTGTDDAPESLVAFDPAAVLAYLASQGLVKIVIGAKVKPEEPKA